MDWSKIFANIDEKAHFRMWFDGTKKRCLHSQFFDSWLPSKVFEKSLKIGRINLWKSLMNFFGLGDYEPWVLKRLLNYYLNCNLFMLAKCFILEKCFLFHSLKLVYPMLICSLRNCELQSNSQSVVCRLYQLFKLNILEFLRLAKGSDTRKV
jgi:hypothetical protein